MNTAQEHAFEQANLVTQLIKYADRVILVESASAPERRAFVKLLADQLPDSIEILSVQASPQSSSANMIAVISDALQLSPGIESPRQLASAVHEAMEGQGRLLMVVENADAWLDLPQWSELIACVRAAHDLAPNQLLFLLTGDIGLTDQLRLAPELLEMQSDMHLCQLLGEAAPAAPQPSTAASARTIPEEPLFADALEGARGFAASEPAGARRKSSGPMLLVAAAISVAIVTFGGFALLTSTKDKPAAPETLSLNTPATEPASTATPPAQADNPLPNDGGLGASSTLSGAAPVPAPATHAPATANLTERPPQTQTLRPAPTPAQTIIPPVVEAPMPKPATAPAAPQLIAPREKQPTEKPAAEKVHKPTKPVEKPVEKPAVVKSHEAAPAKSVVVKAVDNAWYREKPKNRAVLQLGAFNDEKAALDFIKKHSTSTRLGEWHVFSQKRNNQLLYTVTLGDFLTLADARKAAPELAEPLRAFKPYPRTFEAIGKVIHP
jgi:hypothetical protein